MTGPTLSSALRCEMDTLLENVLLNGATPWELDEVLESQGWASGPFLTLDREGLDVGMARRRAAGQGALIALDRMVQEGRLGPKVGVGFYRYPGGGGAVIDPLIDDLIAEEAHFAKRTRRSMSESAAASELALAIKALRARWVQRGVCTTDGFDRILHDCFGVPAGWI